MIQVLQCKGFEAWHNHPSSEIATLVESPGCTLESNHPMAVPQREDKIEWDCPDIDLGAHKVVPHNRGTVDIDLYWSVEVRADGNWTHNYCTYLGMGYILNGSENSADKKLWSVTCPYFLGCIWAGLNIPGWTLSVLP